MSREILLNELSTDILTIERPHPLRVAISGPGTSGKTTLANELAEKLVVHNRQVIRISIDDVYLPGRFCKDSIKPLYEQFVEDVMDFDLFQQNVLSPCRPGGNRCIQLPQPMLSENRIELKPPQTLTNNSILLVDGAFLLHPQLRDDWDLSVWVDVPPASRLKWGVARGQENDLDFARRMVSGTSDSPQDILKQLYEDVFTPGHDLFIKRYDPIRFAHWVVNNSNPKVPIWKKNTK